MAPRSGSPRKAVSWDLADDAANVSFDSSVDSMGGQMLSQSSSSSTLGGMLNDGPPELEDIQSELRQLVKNSALSKASYRAKLGRLSTDVIETNQLVQQLEQQLVVAKAKQTMAQKAMAAAKERREKENGRIQVRKSHLQIMLRCLDEPNLFAELDQVLKKEDDPKKYEQLSGYELAVIYQRLEEIQDLLNQADAMKASKSQEKRMQGATMKFEAVKTYILYHNYNQV